MVEVILEDRDQIIDAMLNGEITKEDAQKFLSDYPLPECIISVKSTS